jgi:hypothetical protein
MVAVPGRTQYVDAADLAGPRGKQIIDGFVRANSDLYANNPAMHIGGWTNNGKVSLDPSERIANPDKAYAAGVARNQISIWDVKHGKEIPTGGTGK